MSVTKKLFGTCPNGEEVYVYKITNNSGVSAEVMDFGAILVSMNVPDKNGKMTDVALGYADFDSYIKYNCCFGATVGPNANRIGSAQFVIDGNTYQVDKNDGANNLHSHLTEGFHRRVWKSEAGSNCVKFTLEEKDGMLGFPGNRVFTVTYTLTDSNRLEIHYNGESDANTIMNLTNHSYFNLKGAGHGDIEDHVLWMKASNYTPVVKGGIPTGEIVPVAGTPMDFTTPTVVGKHINGDFEQIRLTGGYDHNWVIDDFDGSLQMFATVKAPDNGVVMKVYTNLPGVQFYAGNYIDEQEGKEGQIYRDRYGLCLETQFYPDTANKPQFPSAVFGPDRIYDYTTVYEFDVES